MKRFSSVLVANRGEIACRILRTANAMGYRTVAVYTDADANAPHVAMAAEAARIGSGPVAESYLSADAIIAAASAHGAQAIHPGYGFLSENASFARACADAGIVFVGPDASAIDIMGNKAEAKRRMLDAGVPCVPGYHGRDQDDDALLAEAGKIGLPVMVKAAAGGGGKGMRLVERQEDLANAIKLARSEALRSFGSGELILEKALIRPRHVEVQVFADEHGNTISLGERDCSVQRRHQKVIEEAPCPAIDDELRAGICAAGVAAAESIAYRGAGTVEFLLDEHGAFYFLEMNTRLQVEHPVTELVIGLDLVSLQFGIADGEELPLRQDEVTMSGHAIEARLYAEDPAQNFLPTSGPILLWEPAGGDGIRIDDGIASGQDVSPFYDPLLAKIIAWGPDRETARRRLAASIRDTVLFGVRSNRSFIAACLENEAFRSGQATTAFIAEAFSGTALDDPQPSLQDAALAAVLDVGRDYRRAMDRSVIVSDALKNWSSCAVLTVHRRYLVAGREFDLEITPRIYRHKTQSADQPEAYRVRCGEDETEVDIVSLSAHTAVVRIDGREATARYLADAAGGLHMMTEGRSARFEDAILAAGAPESGAADGRVVAPMHGSIVDVLITPGDTVLKGQALIVIEAMKMQHEVASPVDGTVIGVRVRAGQQVAAEDVIVDVDPVEPAPRN